VLTSLYERVRHSRGSRHHAGNRNAVTSREANVVADHGAAPQTSNISLRQQAEVDPRHAAEPCIYSRQTHHVHPFLRAAVEHARSRR